MGVTTVIKDYGTEILDAIRQNNLPRLQLILEKQLKYDSKISKLCVTDIRHKPSKKYASPLILAARQENPQILNYMMMKGTDPNFIHHTIYSTKRREIVTALHIATDLGFYENVEVLLSVNADCNIGDHNQETPLHIAVKKADCTLTRMLLSKGADPTIPDRHGNGALHIATLYGHLQLVNVLLKHDADIFQKGQFDAIPPHLAAKEGHVHLFQLFCGRYLSNINIKIPCFMDGREKAPLHLCAENGHKETVQALLEQYEAEINIQDSDGNTPLHCCVLNPYDPHRLREKEDYNETAKILLKYRISINARNAFGDTALHLASMNHFQRIVEMLLELGANPFLENDQKLKPIEVVPDDDPVTRQVLKMAMLQGPRPVTYPSMDSNIDKDTSSSNLSSGHNSGQNTSLIKSLASGTNTTVVTRDENNPLNRSISIHSSNSTLPSVFGAGIEGRNPNAPLPAPPINATKTNQGQQTAKNEIPIYREVNKSRKPKHQQDKSGKRHSSESSSLHEDTYSFLSDTTTQDGSTQTLEKHKGKDVGIMARRDRKKSSNKRLQTSFDLDASITYSTMSSQTDIHSFADLNTRDYLSELSIQNVGKHNQLKNFKAPTGHKPNVTKRKGKMEEISYQDDSTIYANESTLKNQHNKKNKQKSKIKDVKTRNQRTSESIEDSDEYEDSDEIDEDDESTTQLSQITPYSSNKTKGKHTAVSTTQGELPPGSVRVNSLPGKPGTIELQYSGGPLTIALDTQALNTNMQQDQQGQYFYDQHGNKYPANIIHALQQASGTMGGKGQTSPLVTAHMGDNIQQIFKTPQRPSKPQSTTGKARAPSPTEPIYANQDDINAMINGSMDTTAGIESPLKSPPVQIKTIITDTVYDATKTPLSPTSTKGRSTPGSSVSATPTKEQDHLRKILGRSTPTRRGTTPTKMNLEQRVFNFEQNQHVQETLDKSSTEEETESSEEEESEDDDKEGENSNNGDIPSPPPPPPPSSQPPIKPNTQPPQKQPRRSLQTPTLTESNNKPGATQSSQITTVKTTSTKNSFTSEIQAQHHSVLNKKNEKKHPEKALIISRADQSYDDDLNEDNISPDQWDETPNASPQHKSFSQKLAWAKALEEGEPPLYQVNDKTPIKQVHASQYQNPVKEPKKTVPKPKKRSSKSKTTVAPLTRGEDDEDEEQVLPEYIRKSEEETSSEEESESEDSDQSMTTIVTPANEIKTVMPTERMTIVRIDKVESHESKLEQLQAEAIEKGFHAEEYGDEPGARRFARVLSPTGSGRSTPDSLFSDASSTGRGLNMRVTGNTPKAYTAREKDQKRLEWMKAKPVGIESGSEYSDNDYGSRNSLNRSLSPGGQERARKWSEEVKPVYQKRGPHTNKNENGKPIVQKRKHGKPPTGKTREGTMIGSYAQQYTSFGKIETKTDLLEEAMMNSPLSPMSPVGTSSIEGRFDFENVKQVTEQEEIEIKKQLRTSPAQFLETSPENAQPIDSDEAPNLDSANTSIAESSFKKNIKLHEPGPELYETETVEQSVSIGASEEDLLQAAELVGRKSSSSKITKTLTIKENKLKSDGKITETLTTTVVASTTAQPEMMTTYMVNNNDEFLDSTSDDEDEDLSYYDEEPGVKKPRPTTVQTNDAVNVEIVDSHEKEDIEQYGNEPGVRKPRKQQTVAESVTQQKEKSPFEEFTESPAPKKSKTKKVKKPKIIKDESDEMGEVIKIKKSDESMEILETYGVEPGAIKPKKKTKKTKVQSSGEINETNPNTEAVIQQFLEPGMAKPKKKKKSSINSQIEELIPDVTSTPHENNVLSGHQNQYVTSIGPEDEEVAQINIAADERKKKKKEKKKKTKKQEDAWTDEQRQWQENQEKLLQEKKLLEQQPTEKQKQHPITAQDFTQQSQQVQSANITAAQITFSEGIKVIDETKKSEQSKTKILDEENEDPEKPRKKKKKEKGEKIIKKKKKRGSEKSVESLIDNDSQNDKNSYADIFIKPKSPQMMTTIYNDQLSETLNENLESKATIETQEEGYSEYEQEPGTRRPRIVDKPLLSMKPQIFTKPAIGIKPTISIKPVINAKPNYIAIAETNLEDSEEYDDDDDEEQNKQQYGKKPGVQKPRVKTNAIVQSPKSPDDKSGNESSKSLEDLTGIYSTVMGSKVERSDTVRKANDAERTPIHKRGPDIEEESSSEEESASEYTEDEYVEIKDADVGADVNYQQVEIQEHMSEREKKIWQQYQKQRQESLEKESQIKTVNPHEIKETDIDADIYETNIDDDIINPHTYKEHERTKSEQGEPLPPQEFQRETKLRHSTGRKKRTKRTTNKPIQNQEEPQYELVDDDELPEELNDEHKSPIKSHPKIGSIIPIQQRQDLKYKQNTSVNDEQPHSWTDQKQQSENMKEILQSFQNNSLNYDTASLDSDLYATIDYDNSDPQAQPYMERDVNPAFRRDDLKFNSLPPENTFEKQGSHPYTRQPMKRPKGKTSRQEEDARMWSEQHVDPRRNHSWQEPPPDDIRRPRRSDSKGALSDTESAGKKRRRKKIKFLEDVHSEAELQDLDPLSMEPGKSLQEAAFETLTASLQNQPKLQPRKPLESAQQKPINYTRGVYRPQPVYWRGSRGNPQSSNSRYDDSQLLTKMWSEQHTGGGDGPGTESEEGEEENYYLEPVSVRRNQSGETLSTGSYPSEMYPEYANGPNNIGSQPGAFQPFSPYGPTKRVQIYDEENEKRRRREERENAYRERKQRKKERAPKTEVGPVDFTKYPATAKLWMEQVDQETVQKSKTMYLSVMPEGTKPPLEIENYVPSSQVNSPEDVFLPPQWVIARGRSQRSRNRKPTHSTHESMGSLSGVTSGESDYEPDRPMSPGEQVLLFFRCGNNWTDVVHILFEDIINEQGVKRMVADIQIKHPRDLTGQVNDFMHRWWKKKGRAATIEELRRALDIAGIPYIQEDFINKPPPKLDSEKDINISNLSDNDPEVSRLIQEYGVRSLNTSYDVTAGDPALRGSHHRMNVSADNLRNRLASYEEKGTTINRSRLSNLSASDSVFKRDSQMSYDDEDSFDEYGSDYEARRAFVIVQPQLKQKDYNYETQI